MSLTPGSLLGAYEIVALLGAGGMGEVYRARDINLGRDVAVKILPEIFAADPERISRFEREARVLAALSHPNIATIHGLERTGVATFLIMELAAGETLADRLDRGPIPLDEALPIAVRIASALEAAHEKGVVHRDLKPANVAVTRDGAIKVLDFGLAKLVDTSDGQPQKGPNLSHSPTMTHGGTHANVILGTAAYMSPEQARGRVVDKRTDIWAFGCVLYEMLAGKPAFAGETLTDIVAAVVKNEPDWSRLPPEVSDSVRALLRRCLQKDPTHRIHDSADVRISLEDTTLETTVPRPDARSSRQRSSLALIAAVSAATLMAVALVVTLLNAPRAAPFAHQVVRLELNMPTGAEIASTNTPNFAISPDGTLIVFTGGINGLRRLYIRRVDEFEAKPLRGTETVNVCAFSPDGRAVAFITSDRTLKKISLSDGLVTSLAGEADYIGGAAMWASDGTIMFGRNGALWQIPDNGGTARQITTVDETKNERLHVYPSLVAGGKAVLFEVVTESARTETHIEALTLATGERHQVVDNGRSPIYASSGHLLFFRDGTLLAAPFDPNRLSITGPSVSVMGDISLDQLGNPMIAVSQNGWLAYHPSTNATRRLVWVSRGGVEQAITELSRPYQNPRLAPDSSRVVVEISGGDLWIQDAVRKTFTRLTSGETIGNTFAVWQPDGRGVVYRTLTGMRWIDPNVGGGTRKIPNTSITDIPTAISPDGQTLAFIRQTGDASGDTYVMSLQGDPRMRVVVRTPGYDGGLQFSPDGKAIAYASNESGLFQVYVSPYPELDRKLPVSPEAGTHPKWNPNGRELFYRNGDKMMVVEVRTSPDLAPFEPRLLFEHRYAFGSAQTVANYDVSPDGQRFLMVKDDSASGKINIVVNWFEELRRLAPVGQR